MHRDREKAVANTPHFTIIFTVFYFIQNHEDDEDDENDHEDVDALPYSYKNFNKFKNEK